MKNKIKNLTSKAWIIILIIFTIILIIAWKQTQDTENPLPQTFDRVNFPAISSTYTYGTDFELINELKIETTSNTYYTLPTIDLSGVRNRAINLGFSFEASNQNIIVWSKDQNPYQSNELRYDPAKGTLKFRVDDGFTLDNYEEERLFAQIMEYFGLPSNSELTYQVDKSTTSEGFYYVITAFYQNKPLLVNNSDVLGAISFTSGKFTSGTIQIIPDLSGKLEAGKLNLIENLSPTNFGNFNYSLILSPDTPVSSSEYGTENLVTDKFDLKLNSYAESFYIFYNLNGNNWLIPAIHAYGEFQVIDPVIEGAADVVIISQN